MSVAASSPTPPTSTATGLLDDLNGATVGFELLLNNKLPEGKAVFCARPDAPAHCVGLGIATFLQAALGQESDELVVAMQVLLKAETVATAQSQVKRPKTAKGAHDVYPSGTEYKVRARDRSVDKRPCARRLAHGVNLMSDRSSSRTLCCRNRSVTSSPRAICE